MVKTNDKGFVYNQVLRLATPTLLAVLIFFAKNQFDEIKDAMKLIPALQLAQADQEKDITIIRADTKELAGKFATHVDLVGKLEEEIRVEGFEQVMKKHQ